MKTRSHINNIVFELTGACNQCCRFCYNYWRDGRTPIAAPDPSLARKTLRKLFSQTAVDNLSFSGGEPLLLPNIHDLVFYARCKGSAVNVLTNGTRLTPDAIENFLNLGVGAVQIPLLSADSSVHDSLTSLPGSWEKALAALRSAGKAGVGAAVLVVTKVNAPGIAETLSLIRSCGVRSVMVNRFNIGGNGIRNLQELVPDRKMLQDAFATIEHFAELNPGINFVSGVCTPLCLLDTTPYPHIRFSRCSADLSGRPVTVNYNGDVRFCNHSPKVLGNIYTQPIGEILSDSQINAHYAAVPDECGNCALLPQCGGGCRAASEQVYGNFSVQDPILAAASSASSASC